MQNNVVPDFQRQLDAVFAQLNPQAVEEFYAAYQQWSLQHRITELRQRIETVREQQAENEQRLREAQPSAIALAALARLQSNGVSDIALLDAMLERGESWLDQTMQRLDYFEQFDDFISDDYTKWCQGALEGAFDWIDSLRENTTTEQAASAQAETPPVDSPANTNDKDTAEVEALLLQRLSTEQEEDLDWQEATTLKRPAIQPSTAPDIVVGASEGQELPAQEDGSQPEPDEETHAQTAEYIPQDEPAQSDETALASNAAAPAGAEEQIIPEEAASLEDPALAASEPDQPALIEFAPPENIAPDEDEFHIADEQPPLIESAPVDESSAAVIEPNSVDEQPTFVEFAAPSPSELSIPEETSAGVIEQAEPSEVIVPEDVVAGADASQAEAGEPQEMEDSSPEEVAPTREDTISSNHAEQTAHNTPRKAGLVRRLVRLVTGI